MKQVFVTSAAAIKTTAAIEGRLRGYMIVCMPPVTLCACCTASVLAAQMQPADRKATRPRLLPVERVNTNCVAHSTQVINNSLTQHPSITKANKAWLTHSMCRHAALTPLQANLSADPPPCSHTQPCDTPHSAAGSSEILNCQLHITVAFLQSVQGFAPAVPHLH